MKLLFVLIETVFILFVINGCSFSRDLCWSTTSPIQYCENSDTVYSMGIKGAPGIFWTDTVKSHGFSNLDFEIREWLLNNTDTTILVDSITWGTRKIFVKSYQTKAKEEWIPVIDDDIEGLSRYLFPFQNKDTSRIDNFYNQEIPSNCIICIGSNIYFSQPGEYRIEYEYKGRKITKEITITHSFYMDAKRYLFIFLNIFGYKKESVLHL